MYDSWLDSYFSQLLSEIDERCSQESKCNIYETFRDINDDDLWNILLLKQYTVYPNILRSLPDLPDEGLQKEWVGQSGLSLSKQTLSFYTKVKNFYRCYGNKPMDQSLVLDFGCGWGRFLRCFAKDVPREQLFGCDPDTNILEECRRLGIPGILARSDYLPRSLPFLEKFDIIYAFSVFTHLSEKCHTQCLETLHTAMVPGGLLILTIRPRSFLDIFSSAPVKRSRKEMTRYYNAYDRGEFVFIPHMRTPIDGEVTYGDTCIPYQYVLRHWTRLFEIVDVGLLMDDIYQVPIVLRRC